MDRPQPEKWIMARLSLLLLLGGVIEMEEAQHQCKPVNKVTHTEKGSTRVWPHGVPMTLNLWLSQQPHDNDESQEALKLTDIMHSL